MRAIIQRVRYGKVTVGEKIVAEIGKGYVILLGVGHEDTLQNAQLLAKKIANLRIFEDDQGKMNRSVLDIQGEVIVVSQFTLYADTRRGNRPSFINAALPEHASPLVDQFIALLKQEGVPTQSGIFAAEMLVEIHNDGPVTITLEM